MYRGEAGISPRVVAGPSDPRKARRADTRMTLNWDHHERILGLKETLFLQILRHLYCG